jgi:two-component system NtrC family sensor kinase
MVFCRSLKRLFFFIAFFFLYQPTQAQEEIRFTPDLINQYIGKQTALFQDTSRKLTFDSVRNNPSLFVQQKENVPNLGISHNNNWVRFRLINSTNADKVILNLEYPSIDEVILYVVKGDTVHTTRLTQARPLSERLYKHQFYIFDIPVRKGERAECYLMITGNTQLLSPLTLNTSESIVAYITNSEVLSGLYIGIMLVMILYNLFIYFSARDKSYLVYVNYIFWVAMAQITLLGYSNRYLWNAMPWLCENAMVITAAMAGIGTIIFVKSFLETKNYTPKLDKLLTLLLIGDLFVILLLLLGQDLYSYQIVNGIAGLGAVSIFITACLVYRKKRKPAMYFLLAWVIFLVSVVVFVLKDFGIIFNYNFLTTHSMQIGSAIEAVLLSFALADRINVLKKEKEESQLAALKMTKENNRIIEQQNLMLEIKVKERTEELVEKNDELNLTLDELKQAQIQLVESEKMASLGQLTAGIAHEINNPINFVTANITPLKRDVDVLFHTIDLLESFNRQNLTDEEKIQHIAAFKEEQDFEYLKVEINHLLKGINEGASRTAEIVKSLRIFSRLDEDDLKLADINEGLESTVVIVNNLLNRIKVLRHYGNIPVINCYPGKINQVFLNIISNALFAIDQKFGDKPGGELLLETSHVDGYVKIVIKDNGTGMTEETKKKIFDPFFTTKDVGQGTGLGMSIAFNTIQKHMGSIAVETELGSGTTFTLLIPSDIEG